MNKKYIITYYEDGNPYKFYFVNLRMLSGEPEVGGTNNPFHEQIYKFKYKESAEQIAKLFKGTVEFIVEENKSWENL